MEITLQVGFIGMTQGADGFIIESGFFQCRTASGNNLVGPSEMIRQFNQAAAPQSGSAQYD